VSELKPVLKVKLQFVLEFKCQVGPWILPLAPKLSVTLILSYTI